ncbi:DMT family transporter [Pseudaminobacter arsenicus]|uniref:DMT family transporter n=1 Tax=Borborobacter arsenicus TaxID=1851146 RepID=A0A432V5I6_9HYPH|nr:DMT family transporter [Pseudaminobacter arsenicus]RUM97421.1 DMT family transporter [Pseudaminobacter arsenicus]
MNASSPHSESATPASAILMVFASGMLFSCLDTSAKYLVLSGMDTRFISWARFASHTVLVLILFKSWSNPAMFKVASLPRQLLRGVFLFGSTYFNFEALRTLQLAETTSIYFFAPMVITALAGPLLGEWAGWRRWLAIVVGFVGVLVITRPGASALQIGHIHALTAMVSYCLYVIMTRHMSSTETAESLIFYSALAPALLMLPVAPYTASVPPSALHWALLLALGFFGGFGHWLLIKAYRQATATALAPYPYLQMVWMIGFGYVVFSQFPDGWTLLGAGIIVASGLYIVHREHRLRLKNRSLPNAEEEQLAKRL